MIRVDAVTGDDLSAFVATLGTQREFFAPDEPIVVTRAPGRLDLMGGIADYSGSLVLELPLAAATLVGAQRTNEPTISVRSLASDSAGGASNVTVSVDALARVTEAREYDDARSLLAGDPRRRWAAYVVGTLVVLARERGLRVTHGTRFLISSSVPAGKGVASSAALEVAAMQAVCALYDVELDGSDLALLCQKVENYVVGAPCGVMDQMTASCGESNRLLALLCQPARIVGQVPIPLGLEVWGIDSGVRHEIGGADYGAVRVGAFMGYRVIAELAGLRVASSGDGRVDVDDSRWNGYLANLSADEWERSYRDRVPVSIDGGEFLERYGGITDRVTRVDPRRTYAVRQPTEHPIREHHRVRQFQTLLESGATQEKSRVRLGELMYESHASYGACGLGSSGTDRLVRLARDAGPTRGVYGAKITGGGSGGVVAILAREGSRPTIDAIAHQYARETSRAPAVLGGSSPGAATFGAMRLEPPTRPG